MPGDKNPAAAVARYREHASEIVFLTLPQVDAQLTALNGSQKMQTMVATLIFAGLRREELLQLTHDDIDLTAGRNGTIRIRAKTIDGEFWQPKTKSNRSVPVSSRLRPYLDQWLSSHPAGKWFFPSSNGSRWDADNFSSDLRLLQSRVLLPWTCLHFRHTFGSQLAMAGQSLFKIATLMGNSEAIVRRHYAALLPESLEQSVEFPKSPESVPSVV